MYVPRCHQDLAKTVMLNQITQLQQLATSVSVGSMNEFPVLESHQLRYGLLGAPTTADDVISS